MSTVGLVTGAARGIGAACAERIAGTVDTLVLADLDADGVGDTATAQTPVTLEFMMPWILPTEYAYFLTADAKGFYAEEGIQIHLNEGSGSGNTVKVTTSGATACNGCARVVVPCRDCCHTRNSVLPGDSSQRNTAVDRSDSTVKSGSSIENPVVSHTSTPTMPHATHSHASWMNTARPACRARRQA